MPAEKAPVAGFRFSLWKDGNFAANYTHSYRVPAVEELYNYGPHVGNLSNSPLPWIPPLRGRIGIEARYKGFVFNPEIVMASDQNRLYRNHLSFIKDLAPEMGRGVRFSYSLRFF